MTFTYTTTGTMSSLHLVRLYCMDNVDAGHRLEDEEINNGPLADHPNSVHRAAAVACRLIAARIGRNIPRNAINMSDQPGQTADFFLKLADDLENKGRRNSLQVFAGGRTISGKADLALDTDKTQPSFDIGKDDNPLVDSQNVTDGKYWPNT